VLSRVIGSRVRLGGEAGLASLAILNALAGNLARQIDQR
jgi:hypothetical protein